MVAVFCIQGGRVGQAGPGVAGAASEHPLEGVAQDPTGAGYTQNAHSYLNGRDYKGGVGAEATFGHLAFRP